MEFSWNETQQALWDEMLAFGQNELEYNLVERDANGTFLESNWRKIGEKGILGFNIPAEYGGCGYDTLTTVHALEALGYACPDNGLTLSINGQMWAFQIPLLKSGTEEQKQKYLPKLVRAELIPADAMTEVEAGSDAFSLKTTATKVEGGYRLNGSKSYIGMAPIADLLLIFATSNPDVGRWGITAFLVDADSEGVTLSDHRAKMGLRTGPFGDIQLENVFVPEENRLGREGAGASIFNAAMIHERSFIFASHVGSMARQLDETIAFAKKRMVGGQSIGKHQSVSNRIANMKVRLETARMFLYKAAWMVDSGKNATLEASMAKLAISELFVENSLDAVRINGGRGYVSEFGVERDLRDAVGGVIYGGTSDIQRNVIAALLGL